MSFGCSPIEKHKVYYRGEGDGFLSSLDCVNVMSPSQVCDPKFIPFPLITTYLIGLHEWLVYEALWTCHIILVHVLKPHHIPLSFVHKVKECAPKFFSLLLSFLFYPSRVHLPSLGKNLGVHHCLPIKYL